MDDRHNNPSNFDRSPDEAGRDAFERGEAFREELLSAYLDGECTAAEQAEAEARIAASPELRQLVDDLRNVRASLELLPQHRLEANFAERILRRAEREVLTGDRTFAQAVAQKTPAPARRAPTPATSTQAFPRERFGSSRPFLWSVAALAAAILILITNREPAIRQDGVARGPEMKVAPAAKSEQRSAIREQSLELTADSQQEAAARPADDAGEQSKSIEPPTTVDDDRPSSPIGDTNRLKSKLGQASPAVPPSSADELEAVEKVGEEPQAGASAVRGVGAGETAQKPTPFSIAADQESGRDAADSAASNGDVDTTAIKLRSRISSLGGAPDRSPATPQEPARSQSEAALTPRPDASEDGAADSDLGLPPRSDALPPTINGITTTDADMPVMDATPPESLRVVQVLIGRDAWQSGAVTEVLRKHQIEVLNASAFEELTQSSPSGPTARDKKGESGQADAKRTVELATQPPLADRFELMVVSAPSAHVAATLEDFRQQDQFRVLQVTDASAPEQTAKALGMQRNRGFAYSAGSLPQSEQAPGDRAGKKELADSAGTEPAEEKANLPAADTAKDAPQPTRRVDQRFVQSQSASEKNAPAARPALANEPAISSPAAGRPSTEAAKNGEVRESKQALGVPATSFGAAPAGTERLELQPGYGRNARFVEPTDTPALRGGRYGGYGGGGYAAGDARTEQAASPAIPDGPVGYGQRVPLQPPANYGAMTLGGMAGRTAAPTGGAETFAINPSTATSLGREQVLFFFHVVDTPLPGAADRANAGAAGAGATEAGKPLRTNPEDDQATPVPAAAPGPGAR